MSKLLNVTLLEVCIQVIRQCTPPIFFGLAKNLVFQIGERTPFLSKRYLHRREYKSYENAMLQCSNSGYENSDLVNVVFDKTTSFKKRIENQCQFDASALRVIAAVGLSVKSKSLKVLDFGGASGHHFFIASKAFGDAIDLKWNVVETTAMARKAKEISNEKLNFFDSIKQAKKDFGVVDLVFSSGTLHCCPNPISFLEELINVKAKFIFITRTALIEQEETVVQIHRSTLANNGPGPLKPGIKNATIHYPNVFISRRSFEDKISESYDIKFSILEEEAPVSIRLKSPVNHYGYFCARKDC